MGKNKKKQTVHSEKIRKQNMFFLTLKRLGKSPIAVFGMVLLLILILSSIVGPYFARYGYNDMDLLNLNGAPSADHWCGTDDLGRDVLSRLLYGGRYSLGLGFLSAGLAVAAGTILGAISGYFGGRIDNTIMRICDVLQAIPAMLLAILISATLGVGFVNTIIAIAIAGIPNTLRLMRAQVLSIRTEEYLEAAQSINCSPVRIMFHHVLPNVLSPIIVNGTMSIGNTIMIAASLSFIGLGVQPPTPEWGAMLSAGRDVIANYPHLIVAPGIAIFLTVMSFNFFGDGLRDALDPKLKK